MSGGGLLDLWRNALTVMVTVAAPFLVTALAVGLAIAIVQTATQLQESVLTFVPKLAAALIVVALAGRWMVDRLGQFASESITASWRRGTDSVAEPDSKLVEPTTPEPLGGP